MIAALQYYRGQNMGKTTNPRPHMTEAFRRASLPPMADSRTLQIQNDMRVGGRVFRAGSPVSDVLAAATAAYQAKPLEFHDPAPPAQKGFVRRVYDQLSLHALTSVGKTTTDSCLSELLDAFMVTKVADIAEDEQELFIARLTERLA